MANISQIKLPNGTVYDIYDASALHNIDVVQALVFKGSQTNEAAIFALTNQKIGAVWHASAEGTEWLCTKEIGGTADSTAWEELGNPLVDNHNHTASVSVAGTVAIPAKTISSSGSYTPNVATSDIYRKVTRTTNVAVAGNGTVNAVTALGAPDTGSALTALGTPGTASFVTGLKAHTNSSFATGYSGAHGTGSFLTGLGTPTTSSFVTGVNTTAATAVSIANVTSVGSASTWTFAVNSGVLEISGANSTVPTTSAVKVSRLGSNANAAYANGSVTNATAITAITPATGNAITSVASLSTAKAITAVGGVNTSAALTSLGTPTTGTFVTGLGTPTTNAVLTGGKVSTQPAFTLQAATDSTDGIKTGEDVTVGAKNVSVSGSYAATNVSVTSTGSITTSGPVRIN